MRAATAGARGTAGPGDDGAGPGTYPAGAGRRSGAGGTGHRGPGADASAGRGQPRRGLRGLFTAAGHAIAGDPAEGTRRFLRRRLTALLVATALGTSALTTAYYGVSHNVHAVSARTAPAVLKVAAARSALTRSYGDAERSLHSPQVGVESLGEDYRTDITIANQSLTEASQGRVAGDWGQQALVAASGLVSSYDEYIQQAYAERRDHVYSAACLVYARSILRRNGTGILDRLTTVQHRQRDVLEQQTSFGWLLGVVWAASFLLFLILGWLLVSTQRWLRRHFQRRLNPGLALATLVACGLLPLAAMTAQIQSGLTHAGDRLEADVRARDVDFADTAEGVHATMRDAQQWAGAVGLIPFGGGVIAALVLTGLQPRIDEYRFQGR